MKTQVWLGLLGAALLCSTADDVQAQSRRQERRERKRREAIENFYKSEGRDAQPRNNNSKPTTKNTKPATNTNTKNQPPKRDFDFPESAMKERYRIDVLAPLYLAELVQDGKAVPGRLPEKVVAPLKFYEGMMIAADTLKKLGYKFDVYVYDVSDALESPATLVNTDAFKGSDLILGILTSSDFPVVANYARKNHVNFVSALSPSTQGISENPYFTLLQPTLETHCNAIEEFIYKKNGNISPVMLYRKKVGIDSIAYKYFMEGNAIEYRSLQCDSIPTKERLQSYFTKNIKNVVVLPIMSDKYAESVLRNLYMWFPEYDFEVWGMPSWSDMQSLKKSDAYPNVVVYFTNPFHFDASTASGLAVTNAYKRKLGGKPDNMVFRGYETMFWYAYLMKRYGNIFNIQLWDNGGAPFTRFNISPVKNEKEQVDYYENKHLYLYRYHSSSYMVEQ